MNDVLASTLIAAQFPALGPTTVVYLGEGYDSSVFEVNGEWVFRFPKRSHVEQQLLTEQRILPILLEASPVPVPEYRFHGRPSPQFPRCFVGYRKLPGVPAIGVQPEAGPPLRLAPALGRFLSWLHAVPVDEAVRGGVPTQPIEAVIEEVGAEALTDFDALSTVAPDAPLERWHTYLRAGVPGDPRPPSRSTLVHNDLAAEHVLVDPGMRTVTGVIDWSDIAVSDPVVDFAGMFHWGGDQFVRAILAAYDNGLSDTGAVRARFLGACRGVADVVFGIAMGRHEYVAAGLRALQLCADP